MTTILDEITKQLPKEAEITEASFEAANIILYTQSKDFFINRGDVIRDIVANIKKRIELRPDISLNMEMEKAEEIIRQKIPAEAGITNIFFHPQRSLVTVEAEKPGVAIGKQGEILRDIKNMTFWVPQVRRTPAIKSQIIENIRSVLYQNSDYRKKFLNKVGHRIYDGWLRGKKEEWVRLTTLGAGRHVGRSCFFLQTPESRILLDCGVDVAFNDANAYPMLDAPEFRIEDLDAVMVTHSHIDHSGFVPYLYKMGFRGPTYCTAPTRDVSALLALDYIGVAFKQAKKSLFDIEDVKNAVLHTITLGWEEVADITPDVRATLYNSGHILGSSMIHLNIGNGLHNIVYSGDMKYLRTQLLEPAHTRFPRVETLVLESTYGAKTDVLASRREAEKNMVIKIKETFARGGKVLIPVLGVGRAQEVQIVLQRAIRSGELENIPIYVHGMIWDITAIHTAYPDFLNRDLRASIFHLDENPFMDPCFKKVAGQKEQDQVLESEQPCVIVATAGMLNAGASLEYFKKMADNKRNLLIFCSYQSGGTIGRRVLDGEKDIVLMNGDRPEHIPVNLEILRIPEFTGHAGRNELMRYVHDIMPRPRRIIVNHGEQSKCLDLASSLHKVQGAETSAPKNLDAIRLA